MRRRRRDNLKLILFVLLVSISLGYAAIQTDLSIVGTGKIAATSWDIHFHNVQVTTGSVALSTGDSAPVIDTTTHTDITYTITLHNPGDFYEFTVDVVNSGTLNGMVDVISSQLNGVEISTLPAYMNYSVTYSNDMPIKEKHLLAKNTTETLKVRVEYKTDVNPSDLPDTVQTNTFSFGLTYVQANNTAITRPTQPILKIVNATYDSENNTYVLNDTSAFRSDTYREKIKTITFGEEINPPENVIASWDISADNTGNVMAYVTTNATDNTKYDLYIQGDGKLYANPNSRFLFSQLTGVDAIYNIEALDVSKVTDMRSMFAYTGYNSTTFTLDLGDHFDTSNVTSMGGMFNRTGYSSPVFTLDLGDKFDTSNITDMRWMFYYTGYNSTTFTLDLGNRFDTSNVTTMQSAFDHAGYSSTVYTLNLGDKFDTSNVTDMRWMFYYAGYSNPAFTLDLGDKFDTSNVMTMVSMFDHTGYNSTVFTLDLGNKFDTSNVTDMYCMFYYTGYSSTIFTLNLGNKFDTSSVTIMSAMFEKTGYANTTLELDLSTFDFSRVSGYTDIFADMRTTNKIWVGNATAQNWILTNSGNSNLTTSNVLIKP